MIATGEEASSGGGAAGLCAGCMHARAITAPSGSVFILCRRSETDQRFTRYPRVPVTSCPGHEPVKGEESPESKPGR